METAARPHLNGMCYVYYYSRDVLDPALVAAEMQKLNVKSLRSWSHLTWLLTDADTVNRSVADGYHRMYRLMQQAGVTQIVGMSHYWLFPDGEQMDRESSAMYYRDETPGSPYQRFLNLYERSFETMVREFPEVTDWETGNELNHHAFLHPTDGGRFTVAQRADIATDMMFRAARAIHRANPKAGVIMPGMAPVGEKGEGVFATNIAAEYDGILETLERVYSNIESGKFGSTDPRDFFDQLCWHPYYARQDEQGAWHWVMPDDDWVAINRAVYEVAVRHGDGDVTCVLSEYGYSDGGADDAPLIPLVAEGFRRIREEMPFVQTVHAYRFFDSLGAQTEEKDTYAFYTMKDGVLTAKKRVYTLQQQYGGSGRLSE